MWLYFQPKIYPILRGPDYVIFFFQPKVYPILRGPGYGIVSLVMKSNPFWGDLTMWLYFPAKNLSHSEGTWLCDHTFQPQVYPILRGPGYVIVYLGLKSNPFWGVMTMWLYPKEWNQYISEGTWLQDYTSSQKPIPLWGDLTVWLYPKEWNVTHSEGTWLCDYTFQPKTYPTLRGPDYVIILSSPKSILFWGDLAMWLYP